MKVCKHRWRVGSYIGKFKMGSKKPFKHIGLNIWCEDCDKKIQAMYEPYDRYSFLKKEKYIKYKNLRGGENDF